MRMKNATKLNLEKRVEALNQMRAGFHFMGEVMR